MPLNLSLLQIRRYGTVTSTDVFLDVSSYAGKMIYM